MFEALQGELTFINVLSILAFFTTVGLFFCGIPICRQIWKRQDTTEISGAPFLMGVLGGTCWYVYGWLKKDRTVMYVTGAQIVLYSIYSVFYWFMSKSKKWISIKIAVLLGTCASLFLLVHFYGHKVFHPLGIICMTLNTADFGAPLGGIKTVIRRRATSTMPLPLCIANFMVSTEWFIYGLLVWDFYLITPNGIGSMLAFAQLVMFIVLPRKPMQRAPIVRLLAWARRCCCCRTDGLDLESAAVVSVTPAKKGDPLSVGLGSIDALGSSLQRMSSRLSNSKHRWSSRMINNVVGEVESVIHKVHGGDPFAYKQKKEAEEGASTDSSGTLTPVDAEQAPPAFPVQENTAENTAAADAEMDMPHALSASSAPNVFEQSARSIGKRLSNFARSHGSIKEDDQVQLEHAGDNDDDDEDDSDDDGSEIAGTEFVFPMTIQDASQLAQLSHHFSASSASGCRKKAQKQHKKANGNGFSHSLQAGHFRALRRAAHAAGAPAAAADCSLPPVMEEREQQNNIKVKRAKSVPNILEQESSH